jgi:hypothetical protein
MDDPSRVDQPLRPTTQSETAQMVLGPTGRSGGVRSGPSRYLGRACTHRVLLNWCHRSNTCVDLLNPVQPVCTRGVRSANLGQTLGPRSMWGLRAV